jgi:hypothetical protein
MPTLMTVEFKEEKMIIKHPSGVVCEYSKEHIADRRAQLVKERDRIDVMIADTDKDIQDCIASKVI